MTPDQEAIFKAHKEYAYDKARVFMTTGITDPDDAKQAALLGLKKAIETYDQNRGASFKTHASWQIRDKVSKENRRAARQNKDTLTIDDGIADTIAAEGAEMTSERIDVSNAINELNDDDRAIVLTLVNGHTLEDVASDLGKSRQAIHQKRSRLIKKLRARLSHYS